MILRLAAAVSVAIGLGLLGLYVTELGLAPWSGAEKRQLRRMKDRIAAPARVTPTTYPAMQALPRHASREDYTPLEARGVSLEGYIQRMERAPDGDIHADLAPALDPDGRLVPYVIAEITPQWRRGAGWSYERLTEAFRPYFGSRTRWDRPPARVRLSGWLMNDYEFADAKPVYGFPLHLTQWEIHPVTRIETWDDAQHRFVELPR